MSDGWMYIGRGFRRGDDHLAAISLYQTDIVPKRAQRGAANALSMSENKQIYIKDKSIEARRNMIEQKMKIKFRRANQSDAPISSPKRCTFFYIFYEY